MIAAKFVDKDDFFTVGLLLSSRTNLPAVYEVA
jgi:hypothetical protein